MASHLNEGPKVKIQDQRGNRARKTPDFMTHNPLQKQTQKITQVNATGDGIIATKSLVGQNGPIKAINPYFIHQGSSFNDYQQLNQGSYKERKKKEFIEQNKSLEMSLRKEQSQKLATSVPKHSTPAPNKGKGSLRTPGP
jgi:hypothetical protein